MVPWALGSPQGWVCQARPVTRTPRGTRRPASPCPGEPDAESVSLPPSSSLPPAPRLITARAPASRLHRTGRGCGSQRGTRQPRGCFSHPSLLPGSRTAAPGGSHPLPDASQSSVPTNRLALAKHTISVKRPSFVACRYDGSRSGRGQRRPGLGAGEALGQVQRL